MSPSSNILKVIFLWTFIQRIELVTFHNLPDTVNLNENDDSAQSLFTVSVTCYPSSNSYDVNGTFVGTTVHPVDCDRCEISSNPDSNLFYMTGDIIYKYACSATSCGDCPSCAACSTSNGCLSGPTTYSIEVRCLTNLYHNDDSDTQTLSVSVSAETPTLLISLAASVSADNSMSVNRVLATATKSSGPAIVQYTKSSAVSNTYLLNTANMFELNTGNGEIYVATNPSVEYDYTYAMGVCIHSRRQSSCDTITINFDGCFQTPNCNDQTINSFTDQHAVGATLFTMTYNKPSAHFSSTWQNLNFVIDSSTLAEASIGLTTGVLSTTGNVTVWPDHPYSTHTVVVRVSNPGHSCSYTATCTMSMQFSFTNWPIRFVSLSGSSSIHEDTDAYTLVHSIIVYDYNNPEHDNVTCVVTTNEEATLLELTHNGNYSYNSWFIYKKVCQNTGCGYIGANFLCPESIGCLNYDLKNSYYITIQCSDAYGSSDTATFTLNVAENEKPAYTNTPTTITINTDNIAHLDTVFSIYYTDAESETLDYNFTITPATPSLFAFDTRGNYYNDPANVTSTIFQWDLQNSSFAVSFCGRERRNIVCSSFTIDIREYCGPTPACNDDTKTVTDQYAVGTDLFQIDVTTTGHTSLSYVIITEFPNLFTVNPSTGIITSSASLEVTNPPNSTTYSLVANVIDSSACDIAACAFSVTVTFTNFDISITNMGSASIDLHEDTTLSVTLITIATSDANTNDGVTCEVDDAASTPANNNIFFAYETDVGSNVYELVSKEGPGFDYDVANTYTVVVVCEDNYGSSDTASMTVNILENQVPTLENLNAGDNINVDPMTLGAGDTIFTLQTSDDENDPLVYSCNVSNNFVPLQCLSDGVVSLRRDVRVPDEEGEVYLITLCIEESVHNHTVCETLSVTITSSKTNPVLDNLPSTVSFPENSAVGTTLFTVTVDDPDVLDVHTFIMTVYPKTSSSAFSLDSTTGVLTLQESPDYETLNHYQFLFSVRDVYLPGIEDKYLNLSITNENEGPILTLLQTTYSTIEENTGYTVATLNYTCTDVDAGQTLTLSISSGADSSYFSLDSSTGIITYAKDWDFENGGVLPQTTTLEITCDDGNGLSDAGNIILNIAAKNEFAPVLSTSEENITIYNNQTLLDPLFTVTATDNDYEDNDVFEYSIVGDGKGSRYFTVSSTGQLLISNYFDFNYNLTIEFTLQVSDGESDPIVSHVDVIVTYVAPEPTEPTKEGARCLLCTDIGVAIVSTLCCEGFLMLLMFIHICYRMKFYEVFQLKPKPRPQIVSEVRRQTIKEKSNTDDQYRPGSEMLNRALPKESPPPAFEYNKPGSIIEEPPAAAEYIPPEPAISIEHFPDPTEQTTSSRVKEMNATHVTHRKPNTTAAPSLFQNKAYAPPGIVQSWSGNDTNIYEYTLHDQLEPPATVSHEHIRVSPMFVRPDESFLYSDSGKHYPEIGDPASALDF